jgi:hypothetical protein
MTRHAISGMLPFFPGEMPENLQYGDSITDGGMIMYVNECWECHKRFLGSTLILVEYICTACRSKKRCPTCRHII